MAKLRAKTVALTGVLMFGLVSLLGDVIYEGSRSVISPFLQSLGASALAVGLALGAGDFVGYALRGCSARFQTRQGLTGA